MKPFYLSNRSLPFKCNLYRCIQAVVDHIEIEVRRLQRLEASVLAQGGPGDERLQPIYERLEELDPATFEARAAELLHGLGFSFVVQEILQVNSPDIWQSLLAFNVGVEVGQVAIVLAVWPLLHQIAKRGPLIEKSARVSIAIACSLIALWWTIERAQNVMLAISD